MILEGEAERRKTQLEEAEEEEDNEEEESSAEEEDVDEAVGSTEQLEIMGILSNFQEHRDSLKTYPSIF